MSTHMLYSAHWSWSLTGIDLDALSPLLHGQIVVNSAIAIVMLFQVTMQYISARKSRFQLEVRRLYWQHGPRIKMGRAQTNNFNSLTYTPPGSRPCVFPITDVCHRGMVLDGYTYIRMLSKPPQRGISHLTIPERNMGEGVISIPLLSQALHISIVAMMLAITSQLLESARYCPGQTLGLR